MYDSYVFKQRKVFMTAKFSTTKLAGRYNLKLEPELETAIKIVAEGRDDQVYTVITEALHSHFGIAYAMKHGEVHTVPKNITDPAVIMANHSQEKIIKEWIDK